LIAVARGGTVPGHALIHALLYSLYTPCCMLLLLYTHSTFISPVNFAFTQRNI